MIVDDKYIGDNYYNQYNMDEIAFEKDQVISRMKQFQYKTHKYFKTS